MSRTLPLGSTAESTAASAEVAAAPVSGAVAVYDPAMCCPTGICGPGVDPALLTITRDLRWLEKHGVAVQRFGLAQEADAFVANARVSGLMQAFGDGALPAVLVNDAVLCYGRYPTRAELVAALGPSASGANAASATAPASASCCTPGSGCC